MSILHGVAESDSVRQASLERFCVTYTKPLVNFLVKAKRLTEDDALDLVQDFWLNKMLEPPPDSNLVAKYLIARTEYATASFRSYLSVSLNNYLRSKYRSTGESKRRAQVSIEQLDGWEPESPNDSEQFDVAWANHLLVMVLERVRRECDSPALRIKWTIFTRLILQPYASNAPRPSYAILASELGIQNTKEIGTSLTTFKRIFLRNLHIAVQDYLPANSGKDSVAAAQAEVATLLSKLSRDGGLQMPLSEWGVVGVGDSSHSLTLMNLAASNLINTSDDYHAAWNCLRATSLSDALGVQPSKFKYMTVEHMMRGVNYEVEVLDQIRVQSKTLGSSSVNDQVEGLPLNRKLYGLVYLIAIASAKIHFNKSLSSQSTEQLSVLAKSFCNESWIDEETKGFLWRFDRAIQG